MALAGHYTQVPRLLHVGGLLFPRQDTPDTSATITSSATSPTQSSSSPGSSSDPSRDPTSGQIYPDANGNCPEGLIIFERADGTKICVYGVVPGIGEQRGGDTMTSSSTTSTSTPSNPTPTPGVVNPVNPEIPISEPSGASEGQPQPFVQPQQPDAAQSQTQQQGQEGVSTQAPQQGGSQPTQGSQQSQGVSQAGGGGAPGSASQTVQQGSDPSASPIQGGTPAITQDAAGATSSGLGASGPVAGSSWTATSTAIGQAISRSAPADAAAGSASASPQVGTLDGVTGTRRIAPVAQSSGAAVRSVGTGGYGCKARLLSLGVVGACLALGMVAVV